MQEPAVSGNQGTRAPAIDERFDVDLANELARLESYNKHNYRPNTYLHKWWARRCGTTFRLILKHLVADPGQRNFYTAGGLEGKVVLDPMMGGGTTIHEAIRLGASVVGMDLDPIPILQARASLSQLALPALEAAFQKFYQGLRLKLADSYRTSCPECDEATELWFMLYGLRRRCACREVLLVDSLQLRREPDGSAIRLCADCGAVAGSDSACPCDGPGAGINVVEKGSSHCPRCHEPYRADREAPYYRRYRPLAVAGYCREHKFFLKSADDGDVARVQQANGARSGLALEPDQFAVVAGRKSQQLLRRDVTSYLDLFSSRQLLYLASAAEELREFEAPVALNLALLVSTSLEFNSMLCGYKGSSVKRAGAIRHTFSHHGYSFPYTALENNVLHSHKVSGSLQQLFHTRLRRGRQWARQPRERALRDRGRRFVEIEGERDAGQEVTELTQLRRQPQAFWLRQGSAASVSLPDGFADFVVTDPPYYNNVQYSDLAAFFRVWLRYLLPEMDVAWEYDAEQSAASSANGDGGREYGTLLGEIFSECRRVLRPDGGRLIFTFHHWRPEAWAALTWALQRGGFILLNRYVVHAEHPKSVHFAGGKALLHDAILVLAAAGAGKGLGWERPAAISTGDSAGFCLDCANLLGWSLRQRLAWPETLAIWRTAFKQE